MKKQRRRILSIACVVVILLFIQQCYNLSMKYYPHELRDVSKYQSVRKKWWLYPELIKHFPEKLPADLQDVEMFFLPPFLMGGGYFQLKQKLPADEINKLFDELSQKKVGTYQSGKGYYDCVNDSEVKSSGNPEYFFGGAASNGHAFPKEFIVFFLYAKAAGSKGDWDWNHGYRYGIAINKENCEVVYFADCW
jgi:hypothetical protein